MVVMNRKVFLANRILASLIDGFFMFAITVGLSIIPSITFFNELKDGKLIPLSLFWFIFSLFASFCVWILYLAIPTLFFHRSTLGMKITHLTFESGKGQEIKFSSILFREAEVVVCVVLSLSLSLLADFVSITNSKDGRTFFDYSSTLRVVADNE